MEEQTAVIEQVAVPVKDAIERCRGEILDKIQYLKNNYDEANRERAALMTEVEHLRKELGTAKEHATGLEQRLAETLEMFRGFMDSISGALEIPTHQ
jgi:uncharacterized coiled-coil DUF342 family protein